MKNRTLRFFLLFGVLLFSVCELLINNNCVDFYDLLLGSFEAKAEELTDGYYTYTVSGENVTIVDVDTKISGEISVPNKINSFCVTEIGNKAFEKCNSLTEVTLPDSVISIGKNAFASCLKLKRVNMGNEVKTIGENAFYCCIALASVSFSESVESVGKNAFISCSELKSVNISNLSSWCVIDFQNQFSNPLYYAKKLYLNGQMVQDLVIPDNISKIGNYAFNYCESLKSAIIPNNITSLGYYAFRHCQYLTEISIGSGLTVISNSAFCECERLSNLIIPESVTKIENSAFFGCKSLTQLNIPDNVTTINNYSFSQCEALEKLTIGKGVTSIAKYGFSDCNKLKKVSIPETVVNIGEGSFGYHGEFNSKIEDFTIYCFKNSSAEIYAKENGFDYVIICKHIIVKDEAEPATCLNSGKTEGEHCSLCNEVIISQKTIEPLGHSFTNYKANNDATCTKDGTKTAKCDRCDIAETLTYKGSATGHKKVTDKAVTPTCTKEGKTEGSHCSVCKATIKAQKTIAKKSHTYKSVITTATLTKDGKITEKCSVCGKVKSTNAISKIKSVSLSKTSVTYTGKDQKPTITLKDSKGKTVDKKYYTVSYKNNKSVGKATVTVTFKGNYSGTKTLNFKIVPKGTTVSKVTSTKKGVATATLKKQATQTTGYEIQYSTSKDFKSAKTLKVTKSSTTSAVISKLTSGKIYYLRVRTYKTISKTNYASDWSKAVSVKVK